MNHARYSSLMFLPSYLPPAMRSSSVTLAFAGIQLSIDLGYLFDPSTPVHVLQLHYLLHGPMAIVGYLGYLFLELVGRVACYSPEGTSSTSNWWLQLGHCAGMVTCSASLIRLYRSCKNAKSAEKSRSMCCVDTSGRVPSLVMTLVRSTTVR